MNDDNSQGFILALTTFGELKKLPKLMKFYDEETDYNSIIY